MHNSNLNITHLLQLAARLAKHVAIYDLETTTFRGRDNFAITEMSCFFVSPEGQCASVSGLVDPERAIDERVVELTGINAAMVKGQEKWGARFARMFANMASGECWVAGFNNITFDNHAVRDMGQRYNQPIASFANTFDVRTLHLRLVGAGSKAGKLVDIAASYGVYPAGNLHRAQADVALTVELLNAIIARYGVEAVVAEIQSAPPAPSRPATRESVKAVSAPRRTADKPTKAADLVEYVQTRDFVSVSMLAEAFGREERSLSFEIGKAIDSRLVDPLKFAVAPAQEWLMQELTELDLDTLTQGKLRPIHDALAARAPTGCLDYVQLRIALLNAGQSWSTLQPASA